MSYSLFLDDTRSLSDVPITRQWPGPWEIVRNYAQFEAIIMVMGIPDFVTFDHDLGLDNSVLEATCDDGGQPMSIIIARSLEGEKSGLDCTKFLVDFCHNSRRDFPIWNIHSANPVGATNIRSYIESALRVGHITRRVPA